MVNGITDIQELWIARLAATVVALAFGRAAASFFPAIVLGYSTRKWTRKEPS